jgi:serine protease AprX
MHAAVGFILLSATVCQQLRRSSQIVLANGCSWQQPLHPSIVANSWGDQRIDVFGVSPNNSIWHKFHTAQLFQPAGFENFSGDVKYTPSVVSWAPDRLDYFVVGKNGSAYYRYWNWQGSVENSSWVPWPYHEALLGQNVAGDFVGPLGVASWGPGRLDVVGLTKNGSYLHLYFDGSDWKGWEDFGGNFSSPPSVVAWSKTSPVHVSEVLC